MMIGSLFDEQRVIICKTHIPLLFSRLEGTILSISKKRNGILALTVASCMVMALVETIIEPTYLVKSMIKVTVFLLLPLLTLRIFRLKPPENSFALRKMHILALLCLGAFIYLLIMGAYTLTGNLFDYSSLVSSLSEDQQVDSHSFVWVALYISFCNSFLEEFMFRFISFILLSAYTSQKTSYLFSSIMFALYHVAMIGSSFPVQLLILALLGLATGGLIFDYIDRKAGTIYPSWIVHMFADFALMTIWYIHI